VTDPAINGVPDLEESTLRALTRAKQNLRDRGGFLYLSGLPLGVLLMVQRSRYAAGSEPLQDVFGKDEKPCRLVYGAASLLLGVPVEVELIFEVER
jgi:enamine deaminase RidA (YjgF/YER057c/UK114 family)